MLAVLAVHPSGSVLQEPAVKILVEGFEYLVSQYSIGGLELLLPDPREFLSPVVHNPVEWRFFRLSPAVMWELRLGPLPRAAAVHTAGRDKLRAIAARRLSRSNYWASLLTSWGVSPQGGGKIQQLCCKFEATAMLEWFRVCKSGELEVVSKIPWQNTSICIE